MQKNIFRQQPLAVAVLLALASQTLAAEDPYSLGVITTYSSAIEDRFDSHLQSPSSSSYISGDDIDDQHAKNIQEVLRGIPGITSDLYGDGDGVKIKIRGIENQRFFGENPGVAIIIDGVSIFERTGKVNIDLDNIQSIRVVKGGASYLYGADALAGAVIITTKGASGKNNIEIGYESGSFGYKRQLATVDLSKALFSGRFQYSKRETDGYHFMSNRDSETYSFNTGLEFNEDSRLKISYEHIDRFRNGDGFVSGKTQAKNDPKARQANRGYTRNTDAELKRINVTYSHDFSDTGNFSVIGYQFKDETVYWSAPVRFDGAGRPVSDSNYNAYSQLNNYEQTQRGGKLEVRESFGDLAVLGGLDFREDCFEDMAVAKQDYKHTSSPFAPIVYKGTVLSKGKRTERTRAAYTELKYGLTDFTTLTGNYRYDNISLRDQNKLTTVRRKDSFKVSSWRLGVDHSMAANTSIYAGVSTGFRAPALNELATNSGLDPEHARNYEVGLRTQLPILGWNTSINGSLFHMRRKDFITSVAGQNVNSNAIDDNIYDNIGDVVSQGFELALSTDVHKQFAFDLAYTYLDSYYKKYDDFYLALGNPRGDKVSSPALVVNPNSQVYFEHYNNKKNQVPRTPKHSLNLRNHWHFHDKMYFTLEGDYKNSSYADEINQEKIDSRALLNLTWNYKNEVRLFGSQKSQIRAFFKVENLTNKKYWRTAFGAADAAGVDGGYDGIYNAEDLSIIVNPGRTWSAGFTVRL